MKLQLVNYINIVTTCLCLLFSISSFADEIDPTDVSYVSVNPYNNEVSVAWYKSESENIKYVRILYIYDETTLIKGKGIVDIQGNTDNKFTFKTDSIALFPYEAFERPISLAVDAYSENGNNSTSLREYHTTMVSTARTTTCPAQIKITWTPYYGYGISVDKYEIVEAIDKEEVVVKQCLASETSCFILPNEKSERSFFVRAVFTDCRGKKQTATSSMCSVSDPLPLSPKFLISKNITIENDDITTIFQIDTASDYRKYILFKSEKDSLHFVGIDTIISLPVNCNTYTYIDEHAYKPDTSIYYKLQGYDNCGTAIIESNVLTPIELTIREVTDFQNILEWSKNTPTNNTYTYTIWCSENEESEQAIATNPSKQFVYIDEITKPEHSFSRCYRIEANGNGYSSFSNSVCLNKNYKLLIPNAINPFSSIEENTIFKPKYAFLSGEYSLQIFDRNGTCIFQSNDIDLGWDGTVRNKPATAGVYRYQIRIVLPNGEQIERRGIVHLLYN
ncbi:MAG: gliding motility-associated C-terminal domain-containing protein [Bacteroidales bacterium]|nr:gliding motility-associated C-terminal domain-containing protein [Bacteroidales bacterium]